MPSILWQRLDRAGHEAARLSTRSGQWLLDGSAEIDVNGDGFVTRYPGFWQAETPKADGL